MSDDPESRPSELPSWWKLTVDTEPPDVGVAEPSAQAGQPFEERFPFLEPLAEGGMGEIHVAKDLDLRRVVAVKVLRTDLRNQRSVLARFLREAQVTAQLSHPGVVPLHALETLRDHSPALVMKLIDGITFDDFVDECQSAWETGSARSGEHGLEARIEPFLRVCDAVAYAHSRGVIHRDLKPANLMVGPYGEVYVMDWGLARLVGAPVEDPVETVSPAGGSGAADATRIGTVMGTASYMSPEQAAGATKELTPASDQYSLGLVLYHLLTFRLPRLGRSQAEMLEAAEKGEVRTFERRGRGPEVPPEIQAIIGKATALEPANRYPSVAHFAEDLRRFLRREAVEVHHYSPLRRVRRWVERHPVGVLATLLVVVMLAAVVSSWSLYARIAAEWEGARRAERLSQLVSQLSAHAIDLDRELFRVENLVAAMAASTLDGLKDEGAANARPFFRPAQLRGPEAPPDTGPAVGYGELGVSFVEPVAVWPDDSEPPDPGRWEARFRGLSSLFPRLLVRSAGETASGWSEQELDELLRRGVPLRYLYVGFAEGMLLNYPGISFFPEGYDPRDRPWYRESLDQDHIRWGRPYPDASGSGWLVPCNLALRGPDGAPVAVIGADLALGWLLDRLQVPGLPSSTMLVDGEARLLADTRRPRSALGAGLHEHQPLEGSPLPDEGLEKRLLQGEHAGFLEDDETLYLFARLEALSWYLVARADPAIADPLPSDR